MRDETSGFGSRGYDRALPVRDPDAQQEVRESFQRFLAGLQEIIENRPPERWLRGIYLYFRRSQQALETYNPEIRRYLGRRLEPVMDLLRERAKDQKGRRGAAPAEDQAQVAQELIHAIEHILIPEREQERRFTIHRVSLAELLEDDVHFRLGSMLTKAGDRIPALLVCAGGEGDGWYPLPLPSSHEMMHKGGTPRVILKILAGAPLDRIRAELPPNDFDVIASGDPLTRQREAVHMGVDLEGVEHVESLAELDRLFAGRDINLNQCFFGLNGLTYTQQALEAARTGSISLEATERGLYGSETLIYDGVKLAKNRGMQRLLKFVAEGKADSFTFNALNEKIEFGIYWLTLTRKFARKPNAGELLDRLLYLGRQIGQVGPDEHSIYDVLTRVHKEYPFFSMEDMSLDQVALARWLGGKLVKLADRRFRQEERVASGMGLERTPGDTVPYRVSLDEYVPDAARIASAQAGWSSFVTECNRRTQAYQASEPDRKRQVLARLNTSSAVRPASRGEADNFAA